MEKVMEALITISIIILVLGTIIFAFNSCDSTRGESVDDLRPIATLEVVGNQTVNHMISVYGSFPIDFRESFRIYKDYRNKPNSYVTIDTSVCIIHYAKAGTYLVLMEGLSKTEGWLHSEAVEVHIK